MELVNTGRYKSTLIGVISSGRCIYHFSCLALVTRSHDPSSRDVDSGGFGGLLRSRLNGLGVEG